MTALLVITDGRDDYLADCIASARENLRGPITERWMFDDTGDDDYRQRLHVLYPEFLHINGGPRQGFGGAIRTAWSHLRGKSHARFVFHLEQDFTFNRPVDTLDMARVLDRHPHLLQLALRRQPWNATEEAAGGIVETFPDAYEERRDGNDCWLEHRLFFTTNPCLYRRSLMAHDWPEGDQSEGHFGQRRFTEDLECRSGYWGSRVSGEWVHHIGRERAGIGY